jgi:hypothetical protein
MTTSSSETTKVGVEYPTTQGIFHASPVKLIFYGFSPFYKGRGEINFLDA